MKLFSIFDKYPQVLITTSKKQDGNMKSTGYKVLDEKIFENRNKFLSSLNISSDRVVSLNQIHKDNTMDVDNGDGGKVISETDSLITNTKDLYLSVRVADCVPVFLFDPTSNTICLIHAGWRGLASEIISKTIKIASKELNLDPAKTLAGIGPAICQKHYEVKEDVATKFDLFKHEIKTENGKIFLNLKKIAEKQLIQAGLKIENIEVSQICTFESDDCFSFRRDKPKYTECVMALIGIH